MTLKFLDSVIDPNMTTMLIIIGSIVGGLVVIALVVLLIRSIRDGRFKNLKEKIKAKPKIKKEKKKEIQVSTNEYLEALKGRENILSYRLKGSRIEVCLKDYQSIDMEKLRSINGASAILMSNKLTLVVDGDATKIYKQIFEEDPQ